MGKLFSGKKCFVIAEAGSNHNGDIMIARQLIDAAAEAGADAVKFQLFTGAGLSSERKMQAILKQFEFERAWLGELIDYSHKRNILFTATPFDLAAVKLLKQYRVPFYKIASCDLTYFSLVSQIARIKRPIVLSVGLASFAEIEETLGWIKQAGAPDVVLLHCIVSYPATVDQLNLCVLNELAERFGVSVGLSDHTMDEFVPALAVARGASVIEKHFTLSRKMKGPDHAFAMEPQEFKRMIDHIRLAEKALGDARKVVTAGERSCLHTGRRGLYAGRAITSGSVITEADVTALRPCRGMAPSEIGKVIGKVARKDIAAFEPITLRMFRVR